MLPTLNRDDVVTVMADGNVCGAKVLVIIVSTRVGKLISIADKNISN